MKVRLEDQRIVFRLDDESRLNLLQNRESKTTIDYGNGELAFYLLLDSSVSNLGISIDTNIVRVVMPENYMALWDNIKVGFEENIKLDNGKEINLIIEKDLKRSKKRSS